MMPSRKSPRSPGPCTGLAEAVVLVVDDERLVTESLTVLLHRRAGKVLSASSGREALDLLARHHVDVIVSDEHMPGMSGSDLLAVCKRDFPHAARIMLTGLASLDHAVKSINGSRIGRYLQKPVLAKDLHAALEGVLHERGGAAAPARSAAGGFDPEVIATLSQREREIFGLLVDGLRVAQVAGELFISRETVRNHLKAIFGKLDVHSQPELIDRGRGR